LAYVQSIYSHFAPFDLMQAFIENSTLVLFFVYYTNLTTTTIGLCFAII